MASVDSLPHEILVHVLSYLDTEDLVFTVPHVCQRWRDVSQDALLWCDRVVTCFCYYPIDDNMLWHLENMPRLRHVRVLKHWYSEYTDINVILKVLCDFCPDIESLSVDSSLGYSCENMLEFIKRSEKLTSLKLEENIIYRRCCFGCEDACYSSNFLRCIVDAVIDSPKIKHLSLFVHAHPTDRTSVECLEKLVRNCRTLQTLHLIVYVENVDYFSDILEAKKHVLTEITLKLELDVDVRFIEVLKMMLNGVHSLQKLHLDIFDGNATYLADLLKVVRQVIKTFSVRYRIHQCTELPEVLSKCCKLECLKIENHWDHDSHAPEALPMTVQGTLADSADGLPYLFLRNSWPQLETLTVDNVFVTSDSSWYQTFRCGPNLRHVELVGCHISAECINILADCCPLLKLLNLSVTDVTDVMLSNLCNLQCLEHLDLAICDSLTPLVVTYILNCGSIRCLHLDRNDWLCDSDVVNVLTSSKLEVLSILHTGARGSFLESVKKCSKNFKTLYVCNCLDNNRYKSVGEALEHVDIARLRSWPSLECVFD